MFTQTILNLVIDCEREKVIEVRGRIVDAIADEVTGTTAELVLRKIAATALGGSWPFIRTKEQQCLPAYEYQQLKGMPVTDIRGTDWGYTVFILGDSLPAALLNVCTFAGK